MPQGAVGELPGLGVLQCWCHQALWDAGTAPGVFMVWSLLVHSMPVVYAGAAAGAACGTSAGRAPGVALALPGASAAGGRWLVMPAGALAACVLGCDTVRRGCGPGHSCWAGAGSRALPGHAGVAPWVVLHAGCGALGGSGIGGATFGVVMRGCLQC